MHIVFPNFKLSKKVLIKKIEKLKSRNQIKSNDLIKTKKLETFKLKAFAVGEDSEKIILRLLSTRAVSRETLMILKILFEREKPSIFGSIGRRARLRLSDSKRMRSLKRFRREIPRQGIIVKIVILDYHRDTIEKIRFIEMAIIF